MEKKILYIFPFICVALIIFIVYDKTSKHVMYLHNQLIYPVVGTYQGKSAQGMAIWGEDAYLFNNGGHCRVFDLKSKERV